VKNEEKLLLFAPFNWGPRVHRAGLGKKSLKRNRGRGSEDRPKHPWTVTRKLTIHKT